VTEYKESLHIWIVVLILFIVIIWNAADCSDLKTKIKDMQNQIELLKISKVSK